MKTPISPIFLFLPLVLLSQILTGQASVKWNFEPQISNPNLTEIRSDQGLPQNEVSDLFLGANNILLIGMRDGIIRYDGRSMNKLKILNARGSARFSYYPFFYRMPDGQVFCKLDDGPTALVSESGLSLDSSFLGNSVSLTISNRGVYTPYQHAIGYRWNLMPLEDESYYCGTEGKRISLVERDSIKSLSLGADTIPLTNTFKLQGRVFGISKKGLLLSLNRNQLDTIYNLKDRLPSKRGTGLIKVYWRHNSNAVFLQVGRDLFEVELKNDTLFFSCVLRELPEYEYQAIAYNKKRKILFLGTRKNGLVQVQLKVVTEIKIADNCNLKPENYALAHLGGDSIINTSGVIYKNGKAFCDRPFTQELYARSLCFDSTTKRLYGFHDDSLVYYDLNQRDRKKFQAVDLHSEKVRAVTSHKGNVYCIAMDGQVIKLDDNGAVELLRIPGVNFKVIHQFKIFDAQTAYLCGKFGLIHIDLEQRSFCQEELPIDAEVISVDTVGGSLWLTSLGEGLLLKYRDKWSQFAPEYYEQLQTAHACVAHNKSVYISTNSGLLSFYIKDVHQYLMDSLAIIQGYVFGPTEGLSYKEFNGRCQNAYLLINKSDLYFPSLIGIAHLDLKSFQREPLRMPVLRDRIIIDDSAFKSSDSISLPPNYSFIKLKLDQPYYGVLSNSRVYFKIVGVSQDWTEFDPNEELRLDRLPSGAYTIKLFVPGLLDPAKRISTLIRFRVEPPYYRTQEFYFLMLFALLICMFLALAILNRRAKIKQRKLELIIMDRTSKLMARQRDVERALKIRDKMIIVFSHDIRGPLSFFKKLVMEISHKAERFDYNEIEDDLRQLLSGADSSYNMAENILTWMDGQIQLEEKELIQVDVEEAILAVVLRKRQEIVKASLNLEIDLEPNLFLKMQKGSLEIIVNNILQNALKYTRNEIEVRSFSYQGELIIQVNDNGDGIQSEALLRKLREGKSVKSKLGNKGEVGAGLGLFMVRELVVDHQGSLNFNNLENGFEVEVRFPLDKGA